MKLRHKILILIGAIIFIYYLLSIVAIKDYLSKLFFNETIATIILIIIIPLLAWIILKYTSSVVRKQLEKTRNKSEIKLIISVYNYIGWIVAFFILIILFYKQFGNLVTSIGLIGLGLTLALQKPIFNFVGWISIIANKPFTIGDRISLIGPTGSPLFRGDVFQITLMYTYLSEVNLETEENTGKIISMPNERILTESLVNHTKESFESTPYVWDEVIISVNYKSNIKKAIKILEDSTNSIMGSKMKAYVKVLDSKKISGKPTVNINLIKDYADLRIRYLCNVRERRDIKNKINQLVIEKLGKAKDIQLKS